MMAKFALGGTYWNSGDFKQASEVWKAIIARFPDHDLTGDQTVILHSFPEWSPDAELTLMNIGKLSKR